MWCANCQADVAAEVLPGETGADRVRCALCRQEIDRSQPGRPSTKTEEARELLRRWTDEKLLDPFAPALSKKPAAEGDLPSTTEAGRGRQPARPAPKFGTYGSSGQSADDPAFRFDLPHPSPVEQVPEEPLHAEQEKPGQPSDVQSHAPEPHAPVSPRPAERRVDAAHSKHAQAPHFEVQTAIEQERSRKTNWSSVAGQMLAYLGVAGLTVGTTLVLWGYFGGPQSYTPTGWLVATVGQMLLFLGVITLVSGGLEQTTEEVAKRIDRLGDRLIRIERASYELRGPNIPARRFASGENNRRPAPSQPAAAEAPGRS